ncbi:aspartyl protease family protein [Aestuariibaculum suncheonense]|uniref:Aspartyl protease family protein n=1 Tax=Aestuariibaculum suncheonense TaxID=1028745 RepID=A0A8J6QK18_9FLAO|nr:aspartyl protease family protein [Aestuariibaculum suncheonense]MBD0836442.1 aspartyl protease family protein [Aestuariibaculum suncheonense]
MKKYVLFSVLLFFLSFHNFSQNRFVVQNKKQSDKVKFKLINNLIIVPVEINGVSLSFLLDTGVTKPILFNFLNVSDSLKIKHTDTIYLRGLGDGERIMAHRSLNNVFKIGDAVKLNQDLYAIYDANLNLAPKLGVPVHGIIGFDLLRDLVVEVNYSKKVLKLTSPETFHYKLCRKCEEFNLEFYNNKPYLNAVVDVREQKIPVKLLIDSGGSDALWLFEDEERGIASGDYFFYDFLGHGLSGSVYGKRSKIEALYLKRFVLKNPNVAYPDSLFITHAKQHRERAGSLSGNVLMRFNVIFDYSNAKVILKKNGNFKDEFQYNKSGIELVHDGMRLVRESNNRFSFDNNQQNRDSDLEGKQIFFEPHYKLVLKPVYTIVELREESPAHIAGLQINDIVLSVNGKPASHFTLQKIMEMFYDDAGKHIRLKVERQGVELTYNFLLENPLK